ncbi:MAG: hypothetical protein WDN76_10850 [Alphaproteobacteria bacterium]
MRESGQHAGRGFMGSGGERRAGGPGRWRGEAATGRDLVKRTGSAAMVAKLTFRLNGISGAASAAVTANTQGASLAADFFGASFFLSTRAPVVRSINASTGPWPEQSVTASTSRDATGVSIKPVGTIARTIIASSASAAKSVAMRANCCAEPHAAIVPYDANHAP